MLSWVRKACDSVKIMCRTEQKKTDLTHSQNKSKKGGKRYALRISKRYWSLRHIQWWLISWRIKRNAIVFGHGKPVKLQGINPTRSTVFRESKVASTCSHWLNSHFFEVGIPSFLSFCGFFDCVFLAMTEITWNWLSKTKDRDKQIFVRIRLFLRIEIMQNTIRKRGLCLYFLMLVKSR